MSQPAVFRALRLAALVASAALLIAACVGVGLALDSFHFQHERAATRWQQREPFHYQYTIRVQSSFWLNYFQIEINNNKVVRTIDLMTGEPAEIWAMSPGSYMHETGMVWNYMLIDNLFRAIEASRRPPRTLNSFLTRLNPGVYYTLAYKGLLPNERTSCDPAFPRASYNQEYGYPEELTLGGNPCTTVFELSSPVSVRIDGFQVLP